ncbi:hypothetical protein ONZ45_g13897 [Pleurotus djamor]|nr:hypothetical protein ONZ45_g13897 [Pleurotus djamor]
MESLLKSPTSDATRTNTPQLSGNVNGFARPAPPASHRINGTSYNPWNGTRIHDPNCPPKVKKVDASHICNQIIEYIRDTYDPTVSGCIATFDPISAREDADVFQEIMDLMFFLTVARDGKLMLRACKEWKQSA